MTEPNAQDVYRYWDSHTMGTQFLRGEAVEPGSKEFFERLHPIMFRHEYLIPLYDKESVALRGKSLVEVGCGMGFDSLEWKKRGVDVTSVDLTPNALRNAKQHFEVMGDTGRFTVGSAFHPLYRLIPKALARPFGFKFVITGNKPA
ncbi:MAG: class I SAM-dependent methyltransferase [Planctomycetota bacterium]